MIITKAPFANAAIGKDAQILKSIHAPAVNIAVYEREFDMPKAALDQVVEQTINCRASGTEAEVTGALKSYFAAELPGQQELLEDVLELLSLFGQVADISSFRLLLATVETNMCRRFHTDINSLRMLCTYAGPGTLWLPNEAVNQKAYRGGNGNEDIVLDENLIQQANTGDVVILKGALYPDANPIVHRSPSIENQGEKRLLLRIDSNETENLWG
ncbi:MAG: DUF1826 domain-containing protein [Bacteroidota bacterium]